MSWEYINRITIKKDGVYISSKSSNDDMPYRSNLIPSLTRIYREKGQEGLDKELIQMFCDYCKPTGSHKSILPYANIFYYTASKRAQEDMVNKGRRAWNKLSKEDTDTRWKEKKTKRMMEYLEYQKKLKDEYIDKLYEILLRIREEEAA